MKKGMKKYLKLFFVLCVSSHVYAQNHILTGYWIESKRTLLNDEDGSKYTFDHEPFKTSIQFHFFADSNKVDFFDGEKLITGQYFIIADTLTIEKKINIPKSISKTKFIIQNVNKGLVLRECKPKLDSNYLVKRFYFRNADSLSLPKNTDQIFETSNRIPSFVGGQDALDSFIRKNIVYSKEMRKANITGLVILKLTINKNGELTNAEIIGNPRKELAEEAMRVCKIMPNWEPGMQNNKPVNMYYFLPINFKE